MSIFTRNKIEYLGSGLLGRLATVGQDGTPHVAPVGMISHNQQLDTMDIRGHDLSTDLLFLVSEVLGEVESGEGVANAVPEYLFQPEETRLRQEMAYNLD